MMFLVDQEEQLHMEMMTFFHHLAYSHKDGQSIKHILGRLKVKQIGLSMIFFNVRPKRIFVNRGNNI